MAVIQMPATRGANDTGMITKWHKKTGDWVAEGDELFSFDTDDGTFTVKSQKAGRLVAVFVPEGEIVHCPADVGMLTTPTPDSVLKLGRQQFLDATKPLEARPPQPASADPDDTPETDSVTDDPIEDEPAVPDIIAEEPTAPDEPDTTASLPDDAPAISDEELLSTLEEDTDDLEIMDAEPEETNAIDEEPAEEPFAAEEELLQYVEEDTDELEALDAEPEDLPAASVPEEDELPAASPAPCAAKPASVTVQVDLTHCLDIAARTGVSLAAIVRFAAMHTALAPQLAPLPAASLRALSACELPLPNVCDLSAFGVLRASCTAAPGTLTLLIPAPHEAIRLSGAVPTTYPRLDLTLCFDEAVLPMDQAASALHELCAHLQNLLPLLL